VQVGTAVNLFQAALYVVSVLNRHQLVASLLRIPADFPSSRRLELPRLVLDSLMPACSLERSSLVRSWSWDIVDRV